jgi:ABC-2 type transport system permease protein
MNIPAFFRLVVWELRRLTRLKSTWVVVISLLVAGLVSIHLGRSFWKAQQSETSQLPAQYAAQIQRLSVRYNTGGEAGYWAYYTAFPTWQKPSPLAALSFGVREVVPMVTWVRLLGLEPQLYNSPISNPRVQSLGAFDLAFVYTLLAPLALLLLSHDALSRDVARGSLGMITLQSGGLVRVLAARMTAALLLTLSCLVMLYLCALVWPGLGIRVEEQALQWLGYSTLYLLFWTSLATVVASRARSEAASLGGAFGCWVVLTVLLPSLLNLALATLIPVPQGLELTVRQRQAMHSTWDQRRQPNFERFLKLQDQWPHSREVPEEFTWLWYYAMHELADHSVAGLAEEYVERLRLRRVWTERIAWLIPPVLIQLQLSSLAATDLESHLAHLDRVRSFHQQLKRHFFPLIASNQVLLPSDTARFPRFLQEAPYPTRPASGASLLLLTLGLLPLIQPSRLRDS